MTWIKTVPFGQAEGRLKQLYDRVKGPDDNVDNIMLAHSLRPHSMEGHMGLYKSVLHHSRNVLPKRYLETLGVYVSMLNQCDYCVNHHFAGLKRLVQDEEACEDIFGALQRGQPESVFEGKELAGLRYAQRLTTEPSTIDETHIQQLRDEGLSDGEILEINQVSAYFAYANRTVLGLGVDTAGDIIGLSPGDSDNPNDWNHR